MAERSNKKNVIRNMLIAAATVYLVSLSLAIMSVYIVDQMNLSATNSLSFLYYIALTLVLSITIQIGLDKTWKEKLGTPKPSQYRMDVPSAEFTCAAILFVTALLLPLILNFAITIGGSKKIDEISYCWWIANMIFYKNIFVVVPAKFEADGERGL